MIEEKLVTPPIRAALMEEKGHEPNAKTPARDWWLHWNAVTLRGNQNADDIDTLETSVAGLNTDLAALDDEVSRMLRSGTHAERLAVAPDPLNALWMETDRGYVIYQARLVAGATAWIYIGGRMSGTRVPDERPADLGVNDTGFLFIATDEFDLLRWDGGSWEQIEGGWVKYGTHTQRLAYNVDELTRGTLWVEMDRGDVIYQFRPGGDPWNFVSGTMRDVLAARPADLGSSDMDFLFIATDTGQTFRWTGAAWIDVTTSQTPWTSDIDAAGFKLHSTGNVSIGAPPSGLRLDVQGGRGGFTSGDQYAVGARFDAGGGWVYFGAADGSANPDVLISNTSGGALLRLLGTGGLRLPLPAASPGAGTQGVWYDPADGNRLKYAP